MNFYDIFMFPLEKAALSAMRKKFIPKAKGRVLEIGAGTGVNFKYYNLKAIESITAVDKSINNAAKTRAGDKISFLEADAAKLPFDDGSFDTVVETLLLCSIDNESEVLKEIHRVLKTNGKFIHIDHGLPKSTLFKAVFKALAPLWRFMSRSCRIDKEYEAMLLKSKIFEDEENTYNGIFYGGVSKRI